jgi:hypothetical protein
VPDLLGDYVFELKLITQSGLVVPSDDCPQDPIQISLSVVTQATFYFELVWSTPNDSDPTDQNGTDLDLLLRQSNATRWDDPLYVCYFANPNPDWGDRGPVDNPSLDVVDDNGQGPEVIRINEINPLSSTSYTLGVHYFGSGIFGEGNFGPSIALVKVYFRGLPLGEWIEQLEQIDAFWTVLSLIPDSGGFTVEEINRVYEFMEDAN